MSHRLANYKELIKNISYSDLLPVSITFSKLNVYNSDISFPLQKFWFYLKQTKIIKSNNTSIQIVLSNSEDDKKFLEYIDNLDKLIYDYVKTIHENVKNLEQKKSYTKKQHLNIFLLNVNKKNTFIDHDYIDNNNYIQNEDDTVSVLIELSHITINEDSYWINYSCKQMKVIKNNINIDELDNDNGTHSTNFPLNQMTTPTSIPIPPIIPNLSKNTIIHNPIQTIPKQEIRRNFSISLNDLNNQIKKIADKKINRINENINIQEDMQNKMSAIFDEMKQFKIKKQQLDDKFNEIKCLD